MSHPTTECPFCKSASTNRLSDCFDAEGKRLCELWFCLDCGIFFPAHVEILPPGKGEAVEESRRHTRFNVQFVIEVLLDGVTHDKPVIATVINASGGGICFLFPQPIPEGKEGKFRISLPSVSKSFEATGRVVRRLSVPDGSHGIAVSFLSVDPLYKQSLERYVRSLA